MKANRLRWLLLLLLGGAVFQLPARQSETDRSLLADLRAKAEKGDAQSQYELGKTFAFGRLGVAKDEVEAVKWWRKAADQNYAAAQNNLGVCYAKGRGVAADYVEAAKWYRKAAEQNHASAQDNLGTCYYRGEGVAKDYLEAVKWYRKAAEQGYPSAQAALGLCYHTGCGVAKNHVEGVNWFRKAADQNYAAAQCALGLCYAKGQGVAKDEAEAVTWCRRAAEQNDSKAQCSLAWILATSANPAIRDGSNAVVFAEKAVAATNRRKPPDLEALAAAYAETGQFERAVRTEQEAIALLGTESERSEHRALLKLYEAKVPYRAKD